MGDESLIDAKEKLMVISLLQMAYKRYNSTLENFASYLDKAGVDVSVANLSRYMNGKALPKSKLKDQLAEVLVDNVELGLTIEGLIRKHITVFSDNFGNIAVNNTHLLNDSKTLNAILFMSYYREIIPRSVDKVITNEVDGIPIAMSLAHFLDVDGVYARKKKPVGTGSKFIYEDINTTSSGRVETIYFPERFIRPSEKVLIVDDIIRSGSTQIALANLVRKANAVPVMLVALIGIGDQWKKITKLDNIPLKVLTVL